MPEWLAWPKPLAGILLGLSLTFYLAALRLPVAEIEKGFWIWKSTERLTLFDAIAQLFAHGDTWLGLVLVLFTLVFPIAKFLALVAELLQRPGREDAAFKWLRATGRWSMLDVFVVAILVVAIKIQGMGFGDMSVRPGLVFFFLSVVGTMVVAQLLRTRTAPAQVRTGLEPAHWARRALAIVIDVALATLITFPILTEVYGPEYWERDGQFLGATDFLLRWLLPLVITVGFWALWGATPGKMLVGIRIISVRSGETPSPGWCVLRYVGYSLSWLPLGLGFAWALWDRRKQGWHDKLARTQVVTGSLLPGPKRAAAPGGQ